MTDTTQPSDATDQKYWRTSVAMLPERKAQLDSRLAELGLKSMGEIVLIFTTGEGAVEAMRPIVEKYRALNPAKTEGKSKIKAITDKIKSMSPQQLERLNRLMGEEA